PRGQIPRARGGQTHAPFPHGIPAPVVMKWTGHSDYKAMKPYIDIADDIRANAMNKFNQL
ncbi:hypothetical protein, partial [Prevotella sp. MGM2]|uniref:hypothetical protein n=1 Tax=Prevotella sp. MGM2 TaxID=2033406 RepID=UPI0010575619